ncbi:MAG: hypothetical protein UIT85_01030 [Treponema sp.]|nr:hypothetical protein [Spirochaetia bacterium]MDD7579648.1 hypothetical protein [Treponema sp.]MCI7439885.1 hypothetical protein [Spirochaetia bacterium]MDY4130114.1 hypothetical protein [Treponema sp.]MDY5838707.1 hypothetical protein [Treponema sp.]
MADFNSLNSNCFTITGKNREECMDKLFQRYNKNFQIINFRTVFKKGIWGFGQKEFIEATYQVTNQAYQPSPSAPVSSSLSVNSAPPVFSSPYQKVDPRAPVRPRSENSFVENRDKILQSSNPTVTSNLQIGALSKQIEDMKKNLETQFEIIKEQTSIAPDHKNITKIEEILEDNEFTRNYIKKITSRIKSEITLDLLDDFNYVQECVLQWIGESIPVANTLLTKSPRIIVLIGPTGVGKTTTVAKLASAIAVDAKRNKDKYKWEPRIRMITTDTMRIAAQEQLSRWAEIIKVRVDKAENSEDLEKLFASYAPNSDYIFVDSSGYSPNDFDHILRMRQILDVKNFNEHIYLTVVAGVSASDLDNIIRNYETFDFKSVIVTKCDETKRFGRIISVLSERNKPVSWVATGQEIFKTIQPASKAFFLKRLTGFNVDAHFIEKKFGSADKELEVSE